MKKSLKQSKLPLPLTDTSYTGGHVVAERICCGNLITTMLLAGKSVTTSASSTREECVVVILRNWPLATFMKSATEDTLP